MERMKKRAILLMAVMIFAFNPTPGATQAAPPETLAAAHRWLKLMDGGNYRGSWETAAGYFKNAVPREKCVETLNGVRKPLGQVITRMLQSAHYTTSLPGAPDGQYLVLQYQTDFEGFRRESSKTLFSRAVAKAAA